MSDPADTLAKRFQETGLPADETAYLKARLEAETLCRETLALAAYLGHATASEVLGSEAPYEDQDLVRWIEGLSRWPKPAWVRAGAAAARAVLPRWAAQNPGDRRPQAAIAAAEAWLRDPSEAHRQAAERAAETLSEKGGGSDGLPEGGGGGATFDADMGLMVAVDLAAEAAHLAADTGDLKDLAEKAILAEIAHGARSRAGLDEGPTLREVIRAALVPWLLGYAEPLDSQPTL